MNFDIIYSHYRSNTPSPSQPMNSEAISENNTAVNANTEDPVEKEISSSSSASLFNYKEQNTKPTYFDEQEQLRKIGDKMDQYNNLMKENVLTEIVSIIHGYKNYTDSLRTNHGNEYALVRNELDQTKEFLNTTRGRLDRKETLLEVIILKSYNRRRGLLKRSFDNWYTKTLHTGQISVSRFVFVNHIAISHSKRLLLKKVIRAWVQEVMQFAWKKRIAREIKKVHTQTMEDMKKEYEEKLNEANERIRYLESNLSNIEGSRSRYAEEVQRALLRGVCALNIETMGVFQPGNVNPLAPIIEDIPTVSQMNINQTGPLNPLEGGHSIFQHQQTLDGENNIMSNTLPSNNDHSNQESWTQPRKEVPGTGDFLKREEHNLFRRSPSQQTHRSQLRTPAQEMHTGPSSSFQVKNAIMNYNQFSEDSSRASAMYPLFPPNIPQPNLSSRNTPSPSYKATTVSNVFRPSVNAAKLRVAEYRSKRVNEKDPNVHSNVLHRKIGSNAKTTVNVRVERHKT